MYIQNFVYKYIMTKTKDKHKEAGPCGASDSGLFASQIV